MIITTFENMFDFTELIKQKFELFSGKRLEVEDQRLLNAVNPLVEEEVADFVRTTVKNNYLINEAINEKSNSEAVKELESLLASVEPEWRLKITSRINSFLNQLVYESIQKVKKNE